MVQQTSGPCYGGSVHPSSTSALCLTVDAFAGKPNLPWKVYT